MHFLNGYQTFNRVEIVKAFKYQRYLHYNSIFFVYIILESDEPLYVGSTSNVFWRMQKHQNKISSRTSIYIKSFERKVDALREERHFIRLLKPKYNKRHCNRYQLELL
ncbi:GIY-YIG nuclease family protein [Adhaeribacter rhizoryzae]|uniref:GIY-YIG domain-containing protein n=1 Tax=Adhaeribacter rhizoryzae TaxID=2607907 RepID=A0A5M6D1Q1_9BACT|nr:hypothetical protein F0145_25185 [Adhaeribacter rhizoryzae]